MSKAFFLLQRTSEPKDRRTTTKAAVLRVGSAATNREILVFVYFRDGMGGLREGRAAASNALSAFLASLVTNRRLMDSQDEAGHCGVRGERPSCPTGTRRRLHPIRRAFRGGFNLHSECCDSRIYAVSPQNSADFKRLTVDDTMEEAYGAEGRGLLQFIGMKGGLLPHINQVSNPSLRLVLTTDGAHFVGDETLRKIGENAPDVTSFGSRVLDAARWLGGSDNATIIIAEPSSFSPRTSRTARPTFRFGQQQVG